MANASPSIDQLSRAIEVKKQIEKLEAELAAILSGLGSSRGAGRPPKAEKAGGRKKRQMSPEAREKIAAAQRARWAKQKKADKKA